MRKSFLQMSKENFLDKYFVKRKEGNTLTNEHRVENENIITQSNTVATCKSNQLFSC